MIINVRRSLCKVPVILVRRNGSICKSCLITVLSRLTGLQEVKSPRFLDNQHMKVVGYQPYATAAFIPRIILLLILRG